MCRIGTYVLFNYDETPQQFFNRLEFSIRLNKRYDVQITSFPMKFVPFKHRDRSHVSELWNKRWLRGLQCILLATRGQVSPKPDFFHAAFGQDYHEFAKIVSMPEHYIIWREKHRCHEAADWEKLFMNLTREQRSKLLDILIDGRVTKERIAQIADKKLKSILEHYINEHELAK